MAVRVPEPMQTCLFFSLWGFGGTLEQALETARRCGFDGLELNVRHPALWGVEGASDLLRTVGMPLILELATGGDYVPDLHLSPADHLRELEALLECCTSLAPLRVTALAGSDAWPAEVQGAFLEEAVAIAGACGLPVSFETHRSRCLGHPWSIPGLLERVPDLRLTADLSHWCVVAERLMTPELEPIQAMAGKVDHIHARVGHAQGPQVAHPFAPEYAEAREAHRACWQLFADGARARGVSLLSFTPEFGPDGYLPTLPFTGQPVADLLQINTAMARWLRAGFADASGPRYIQFTQNRAGTAMNAMQRPTGEKPFDQKAVPAGQQAGAAGVSPPVAEPDPNAARHRALVASLRERYALAVRHQDAEAKRALFKEAVYLGIRLPDFQTDSGAAEDGTGGQS